MQDSSNRLLLVREWVEKAENDLALAGQGLKMGADCPTDGVCFHAQQCVEKYLKALLVWKGIQFPKTHNISELFIGLKRELGKHLLNELDQDRLTEYATVTRYPGDYEPITLNEARLAVNLTRKVKAAVRKYLPKEALKKEK